MPLVPKAIRDLRPYPPGKAMEEVQRERGLDRVIKLASNENPWGPSPRAVAAVAKVLASVHRYPDMLARDLRGALSERFGVKLENVIVGSGSEGIMANIMRTFLCDEDEILTAMNTFVGFMVLARGSGRKITLVDRRPDYRYDLEAMSRALGEKTKIIYLANPDNPTGTIFTRREFDGFMARVPSRCLVIYDEAYIEFARDDPRFPDSLSYRYDNVITLRTFSKAYGLAGLRIGYGFARSDLIANLMKVKLPFEPSVTAQVAGRAALEDREFLESTLSKTRVARKSLQARLAEEGFEVLPGCSNFLAVKASSSGACRRICAGLVEHGVIVRPLEPFGYPELFRVTIGTDEENAIFLRILKSLGASAENP